jgi:hypothetical protein
MAVRLIAVRLAAVRFGSTRFCARRLGAGPEATTLLAARQRGFTHAF